jgi:uncharacterized OB-fold protein
MNQKQDTEYFEVDQHITAHSRYWAGKAGSRFYIALRDEKKILGSRCDTCDKVFWPPRTTCGRCFSQLPEADMVEVGPGGVLESFTVVNYNEPVIHPKKVPFAYGIIKLDGADCGIAHFIDEIDLDAVEIGMRLTPVFSEDRQGNILDIKYFKPE